MVSRSSGSDTKRKFNVITPYLEGGDLLSNLEGPSPFGEAHIIRVGHIIIRARIVKASVGACVVTS